MPASVAVWDHNERSSRVRFSGPVTPVAQAANNRSAQADPTARSEGTGRSRPLRLGRLFAIAMLWPVLAPGVAFSQYQPPSDYLHITADQAFTWSDGDTSVVQALGPVIIQTDRAKLTA